MTVTNLIISQRWHHELHYNNISSDIMSAIFLRDYISVMRTHSNSDNHAAFLNAMADTLRCINIIGNPIGMIR
jgi:hypothetical protein